MTTTRSRSLPLFLLLLASVPASAESPRERIVADLAAQARAADPGFAGFSAARGAAFYKARPGGATPQTSGQTRAGKPIEPMAVSRVAHRYTDPEKVNKWFGRNCESVLGRECTPREKGDFLSYMLSQ
jgi:hypothetical protein